MASKPDFEQHTPSEGHISSAGKDKERNDYASPDSIARLERPRIDVDGQSKYNLLCTEDNPNGSERRSVPQLRQPLDIDRIVPIERSSERVGNESYLCISTDIIPEKKISGLVLPNTVPSLSGRICVDSQKSILYCGEFSNSLEPSLGIEFGQTIGIKSEMEGFKYEDNNGFTISYCRDAAQDLRKLVEFLTPKTNSNAQESTSVPQIASGEMP